MNEDIAVRYVLQLIDEGSARLLEKDRAIRKSTGETTSVMRRQAEQARTDASTIRSAADVQARAFTRAGTSSLESARRQREASSLNVTAMEQTARGAEEMERRAARSFRQTVSHVRQTHGPLRDLARAGAALGGTYLGYEKAKGAVEDTLTLAKTTGRLSNATGLAVQNSSALLSVTRARGIADGKLETSLGILATKTDQVAHGTDRQRRTYADLNSVAQTFTGRQRTLAQEALGAARGSTKQVQALTLLRRSLADEAAAHAIARSGRRAATLSQAQQYSMTKAQISAWHDQQAAMAAGDRQSEAVANQTRKRQTSAIADALAAASSTNKQAEAFHRLGISQDDVQRGAHDMNFLLGRVAEGFDRLGAGVDKVALSRQLFGRGSAQLMPIIESYQEQIKLAKEYGATLDGHTIKSLEQMEEAQRKVRLANTAVKLSFTQAVQPALLSLAHSASDVTRAWSDPKLNFDQRMEATAKGLEKLHIGEHLGKAIEIGLPLVANSAAKAAPVILGAIAHGFAHAGLVGDAVILAWGAKKLGLWSTLGKTAGKAFFAKFIETDVAAGIAARFGIGTGGVAGRRGGAGVAGLLGATPETALWVRSVGGLPGPGAGGGTLVRDAEKVGGGAGLAAIARTFAARALPVGAGALAGYEFGNWASKAAGFDAANGTMRQDIHKDFGLQRSASDLAQTWGFISRGGTDDPNKPLNEFGDKIHKLGDDLRTLPLARLLEMRREAMNLLKSAAPSKDETDALNRFAATTESVLDGRVKNVIARTEGNFAGMRISTRGHLKDIAQATRDNMATIAQELGTKSEAGKEALAQNFQDAAGEIRHAMREGRISTSTGLDQINALLSKRLELYGLDARQARTFVATTGIENKRGAATGGYIGMPGERGTDRVHIVVGRGESVNTIHQQREINQGLAIARAATGGRYRWGSLDDLYGNVTTRHSDVAAYARGGFAGAVREADAIARHQYNYEWGGGHNPSFSPTHGTGHGSGPGIGYDCSGAVSRVLHAAGALDSPLLAGGFMSYGAPGPGKITLFASPSHVYMRLGGRYFGTSSQFNHGGGADWFPGSPRPGFVVRHPLHIGPGISSSIPRVRVAGLGGELGALAQRSLDVDRAAAQSMLRRAYQASMGGGGPGGGGPGGGDPGDGSSAQTGALQRAWRQAGGPARMSWIMAQIALAESGGALKATNTNTNGTIDRGPWQVNSVWGHWSTDSMGNLAAAARAAVHVWRTQGLGAWTSDRAFERYVRGQHRTGPGQFAKGGYAWGGWHGDGTDTTVSRPTLFGAGERGPERVTIQPMERGGWPSAAAATSTLLRAPDRDLQRSGSIHRQALAGLSSLLDKTSADAVNAVAVRIRDVLARLRTHNQGDLRVPLLTRAIGEIDTAMYRRAGKWIAGFAQTTTAAGAKQLTSSRLGQLPTVLANVGYGELGTLAADIRRDTGHLTISDRRYKQVQQAAQAAKQRVEQTKKATQKARDELTKDRKAGASQRTLDADQASVDADVRREHQLADSEKAAQKHVAQIKHRQQITTARLTALRRAATAVRTAQNTAIDRAAAHADTVAGIADRIETQTQRRLRRKGIDPSSSRGLTAQAADSAKEIGKLEQARSLLQTQLARAAKLGDRGRVSQIRQQLATVTDSLGERRTQQIEHARDLARRREQDKVDTADFGGSLARSGLEGLQISQQLLGTSGTVGGGQQIAEYINSKIAPADQKRLEALQAKLKELQSEPTKDSELIRQTLLDIAAQQNVLLQDNVDAANAVKDNTDNLKDFGGSASFGYRGQDELDTIGGGVGL